MTLFIFALVVFLLAFAGLATGLLLKRRGLRGGCGSGRSNDEDCQCKASSRLRSQVQPPVS